MAWNGDAVLPKKLYHGSAYQQAELMPGFKRSGQLVEWDKTENNKFLYATTDKDSAIELGFASSIEKKFRLNRFKSNGKALLIETSDVSLTVSELNKLEVFLYTLTLSASDGWVKNSNEHNGLLTEFKTDKTITSIEICKKVDIKEWLSGFDVQIKHTNAAQECLSETLKKKSPNYLKWM